MKVLKKIAFRTISVFSLAFLVGCGGLPTPEELDSSSSSGGGNYSSNSDGDSTLTDIKPIITIQNNTGYSVCYMYIKSSTSSAWGSDVGSCLSDGKSTTYTLSKTLSEQSVYDIQLRTSSGDYSFRKYKITVSNGMTINFTASDLNNGNDLPTITIQNRIGVGIDDIYIKPSAVSDWGSDLGSISNNYDLSKTISIPSSNYTVFDIQVTSSNPTATYTKRNVTISGGEVITFTRADADNPLIGSPVIVIQNNTGYSVCYMYIKSPTSAAWGSDVGSCLSDGKSTTYTLSKTLSEQIVYDIQLRTASSGGYSFRKYRVTVSDGMIITFTASDLDDGSNLPTITIQNRIGVGIDDIYIKPSVSSDWGADLGSISNNYDLSKTISIPPSNYTVFDIQVTSSNPTATYTKRNVTISGGEVITFTRANADNPLIGSPVIVIQNNTGYSVCYMYIKSPTSAAWGSDVGSCLSDGKSTTYTLSKTLSEQSVYDIQLRTASSGGTVFTKFNFSISDGVIITFNSNDLE
ncbi:hypothetical protein AGMMS49938_07550 [Fibrobacterales bacterium]|nr:hypothetical protein AGMMS49938_07550 [Fibrobacterales bacterium]